MIFSIADFLIVGSALLGHAWVVIFLLHHVHSARMRRGTIDLLTYMAEATFLAAIVGWGYWLYEHNFTLLQHAQASDLNTWQMAYLVAFGALGAVAVPMWVGRRLNDRPPKQLKRHHRNTHDIVAALGHSPVDPGHRGVIAKLPGNQAMKLDVIDLTVEVPRLHPKLEQLSIIHLSDLHFGHGIRQEFFEEVVRVTNDLNGDLIAVTGDIVDDRHCVPWIPETLGKLKAELGVYSIFGNHDWLLNDLELLRNAVDEAGHIYLGGRTKTVRFQGQDIVLAGNELPWVPPAADPAELPPRDESGCPLRVLLAHSPDQFAWARRNDFDLMLAGHTHGGQLALPRLGPLFTASRTGTAYSAGTFFRDPTLMHVTRGVSGSRPLRYNCPPEITKITLRCPEAKRAAQYEQTPQELVADPAV